MAHLRWTESDVLEEFGRIMTEQDGLKKVAQVAAQPLTDEEQAKLTHFLDELRKNPSNGPGMERWINRLKGVQGLYYQAVYNALMNRYRLWSEGKSAQELSAILIPNPQQMAEAPAPAPAPITGSAAEQTEKTAAVDKTAEEKKYEVQPDSDMVGTAHPGKAMVNGDLVENLEQQQAADLAVARKSAMVKEVLAELYKMAKKLQAENNDTAYELVKKAFKEIAATLKK